MSRSVNSLGIVGNELLNKLRCHRCGEVGNELMKRLHCGHSIHQECLKEMIKLQDFVCETDSEVICPGFLKAMGIQVKNKRKAKVECAFIQEGELPRMPSSSQLRSLKAVQETKETPNSNRRATTKIKD